MPCPPGSVLPQAVCLQEALKLGALPTGEGQRCIQPPFVLLLSQCHSPWSTANRWDVARRLLTRLDISGQILYFFDMASKELTARSLREAGASIREQRLNRGLSPEQLGHLAGVSGRTVRRIEEGKRPTVRTMFQVAQILDCEVVDLWPS